MCTLRGEKQVTFYAHENDFRKLVYTPDTFLVELDIEGSKTKAVMQDIQFHPVTDKILHIDFLEVFDNKPVTVSLPVILQGIALGVRNGGNLLFRRPKIITKGLISNLPDSISINVEDLAIGMFIYIKDISIDGWNFSSPNSVVVGVKLQELQFLKLLIMKMMKNQQKNQKPQVQMKRKRKEMVQRTKVLILNEIFDSGSW